MYSALRDELIIQMHCELRQLAPNVQTKCLRFIQLKILQKHSVQKSDHLSYPTKKNSMKKKTKNQTKLEVKGYNKTREAPELSIDFLKRQNTNKDNRLQTKIAKTAVLLNINQSRNERELSNQTRPNLFPVWNKRLSCSKRKLCFNSFFHVPVEKSQFGSKNWIRPGNKKSHQ